MPEGARGNQQVTTRAVQEDALSEYIHSVVDQNQVCLSSVGTCNIDCYAEEK